MTVGFWIRGQSRRYKTFVAHRVGEIHEDSNPVQWRYVPTLCNPADHGTRGLTVSELKDNELWWNGPDFLREPREKWPEEKFVKKNAEILQETEIGTKRRHSLFECESTERKRRRVASKAFKVFEMVSPSPDNEIGVWIVVGTCKSLGI